MIILSKNSSAMFVASVLLPCVRGVWEEKCPEQHNEVALSLWALASSPSETYPTLSKLNTAPPVGNTNNSHQQVKFCLHIQLVDDKELDKSTTNGTPLLC